jgi:RNA polymerase sigma factor (sigma-70 family)
MSERAGGRVGLDEEGQQLAMDHLWLADVIAHEMRWLAPMTVDGDVVGPARLGLTKAALHLDPARRARFVGYARKWIAGAIFDAVDRKHPGFTAPHRAALEAFDQAEEGPGPEEKDEAEKAEEQPYPGSADPLEDAAVAMGLGSASVRLARGGNGELGRILEEELSRWSPQDQGLFVGRYLEHVTWEGLAQEAGVSESTAKRRVAAMRAQIIARLRTRGVLGPAGWLGSSAR